MNKSLHHRLLDLEKRISALESKPKEPAATISIPVVLDAVNALSEPKKSDRKMCPKCGVKPNHFFHVKTCKGQQKEQKNDEDADRRRDQGKT